MTKYLLQTTETASPAVKSILYVLGYENCIGDYAFPIELTSKQVTRLLAQPWISYIEPEGIVKAQASRRVVVIRDVTPPPSNLFVIMLHKRPTKAQQDLLWLLGCDVEPKARYQASELTPRQIERLKEQDWVKNVVPQVQYETCKNDKAGPGIH